MSLIVGHAAPDIGFLVADTLLSFPNGLNLEVSRGSNSKGRFGETPKPAREARALPQSKSFIRGSESVFAEEELVDAAENFFDANGRGEEAVAGQDSAGDHLAFRAKITQRKNRRVFESSVDMNLALDVATVLTGGIDQDEIGLEPTGSVERQFIIVLFANEIFPGAFQCPPDETSDAGFVIN